VTGTMLASGTASPFCDVFLISNVAQCQGYSKCPSNKLRSEEKNEEVFTDF